MRPLVALVLYLLFIFVGGALLAPWLYKMAHFPGMEAGFLKWLASQPFHRFVSRAFLILGVAGLWPFLKATRIQSLSEVGLDKPTKHSWKKAGLGLLLGFLSLALVAACAIVFHARFLNADHTSSEVVRHLRNSVFAAVAVAFLEELFFRGVLITTLARVYGFTSALILSSATYAILHFLQRVQSPEVVTPWSGLFVLGQMSRGFIDLRELVPAFFNLFLAGLILGMAFKKTAALYFSIGLHAGWIFWSKSYAFLTTSHASTSSAFWGTGKLIDGWGALICLLAVFFLVRWQFKANESAA